MSKRLTDLDPADPASPSEAPVQPRTAASDLPKAFVPPAPGVVTEPDAEQAIRKADADFRREFARKLFFLFACTVFTGPILVVSAAILQTVFPENFGSGDLLDKVALLATSLVGTVAGVFGTVIGFYYGTKEK